MAFGYRGDLRAMIPHPIGGMGDGLTYGAVRLDGPCAQQLTVIFSGAEEPTSAGWEHVSVSCPNRPPNWREMCFVKDLFWDREDTVVQFHPPASAHINLHPNCLHLWRSREAFPMPPVFMV